MRARRFGGVKLYSMLLIAFLALATSLPLLLLSQSYSMFSPVNRGGLDPGHSKRKLDFAVAGHSREDVKALYKVTLLTGDIVTVGVTKNNKTIVLHIEPNDPVKFNRAFKVFEDDYGVYVVPSDVDLRKVDLNLFNVKYLVDEGYHDLPHIPIIVELSKKSPSSKVLAHMQSILDAEKSERILRSYNIIPVASVQVSPGQTFYKLISSDYVKKIWLNYRVRTHLYESAPLVGAPEVWNLGFNGSGVKIAILDTGIDSTHPHFYFNNGTSKIISQVDFTDDGDPYDHYGHGTHVASIAAGAVLNMSRVSYILEYAPNEWFENGVAMGWRADDGCWMLELPFRFPFNGVYYTRIYVSSNGLVSFQCDRDWINSIERLSRKLAIAPAWDDWRTDVRPGDDIYVWQPDNSSLAIRWKVVAHYDTAVEANFGVVLHKNGTIKFVYGYNNGFVSATVGISYGFGEVIAEDLYDLNFIETRVFKPVSYSYVAIRGVAPGALIMNVKVLNRFGWGYLDWVIAGIEYSALGPDGVPSSGDEADIISMSLGTSWWTDGTDPLSMACDSAVQLGRIVVVAAGNWGAYQRIGVPATARKVITVGASDKSDGIAYFSSRGPTVDFRIKPDLVAPGVGIWAALARGSLLEYYAEQGYIPGIDIDGDGRLDIVALSGTSMATPHVSGAVALVRQARQLNATMIKDLLISTSKDLGYDVYTQGGGRLNVLAAIKSDLLIAPATVSLGLLSKGSIYNFSLNFINTGSEPIRTLLYPRLIGVFRNSNFSNVVALNVTELIIPAGETRNVLVSINASGLPPDYYSGIIYTNYTIGGSSLHAIFGFAKLNVIDITFYGLDGATPIPRAFIGIFKANATEGRWMITYTNEYGRATLYVVEDGLYYVVGADLGKKEYSSAYSIKKIWVSGTAVNLTLSLKEAHKISYSPPVSNQIIGAHGNGILYAHDTGTTRYALSLSTFWYYPSVTDVYITSTDLVFHSSYQHYDRRYINVPDPSTLISPELYSTIFVNRSITSSKTVRIGLNQLAVVKKNYKVALTPYVSAATTRTTIVTSPDWHWYAVHGSGLYWKITSPKTVTEYLGWDIPPSAYIYYYTIYGKLGDQPNVWTPHFEFYGREEYWEPGTYLLDMNSHPLDPDIYIYAFSYDVNGAYLYLFSDLFSKIAEGDCHYSYSYMNYDHGFLVVKVNGAEVYRRAVYDYIYTWFEVNLPARIEVELYAYSNMGLSTEMSMKVEFEVPIGGSVWLNSPFSIYVKGLDLNNTHPGGVVRGHIYRRGEMRNTTLEYSLDDGQTWRMAILNEGTRRYDFVIPSVSDSFVSFRLNSTIGDVKVSYTIMRGFYARPVAGVGRLRVETVPPVPARIFLNGIVRNSWGLDWVRVPAGNYMLSFSDVPYHETPEYVEVTIWPDGITMTLPLTEPIPVLPDKTTEVRAHFMRLGSLKIETSPPVPATIFINGVPCNEWGLWVDIEPGSYTIEFEPIDGYKTPPAVTVTVERGKLVRVIGDYISGVTHIVNT